MRLSKIPSRIAWCLGLAGCFLAHAAPVKFDLPAQSAAAALLEFARQAGVEVLFSFDDLKKVRAAAVVGRFEPEDALDLLLRDTGYSAQRNAAGKFVVTARHRFGRTAEIRGSILSATAGSPVPGAIVRLGQEPRGVRAAADGGFLLRDVPIETTAVLVSAEGFVSVRVPGIALQPGRRTELGPVRLLPADEGAEQLAEIVVDASELGTAFGALSLFSLREMIVTPSRFGLDVTRSPIAATLTESDLLALPQLGDDLYRAISHLPGLAADDTTARFWVRGAPHEQLLARLDGVDLLEPFHLKDTDGALSILDLETIGRLNLHTGGFTAEFGDRLAGVLTMETDRHTRAKPRTTLGLSLTGGRVASRGQTAGGRTRWLLSARSGYPDIAIEEGNADDRNVIRPRYHDVMGKWELNLTPRQTLSLHALHAGDRMYFRDGDGPILTSRYDSDYGWARWQGDFGRVTGEGVLSWTAISWHRDAAGLLDGRYALELHERRTLRSLGLRQDWTASLSESALLRGGFELKSGDANYTYRNADERLVLRNGSFVPERTSQSVRVNPDGRTTAAYLTARVQPGPTLTLEPGLRFDANTYAHDSDVTPRFSAALQQGRTTWRTAWGLYAQAQALHQLAVQDGDTRFRQAERAEHRVLSFEHRLDPGINLRLEGYERIVKKPRPHWDNAVDSASAMPELDRDRVRVDPVRARARGIELIVERRGAGKLAWSASYAFARSEETLRNGRTIARARDQRHTFYVDASYTPNPRWQFSAAWQYHTGWPTTGLDYSLVSLAGGGSAVTSSLGLLNALRLPAYQRFDLRAQRRIPVKRGTLRVYLDVFNVFNRRNTIDFAYDVSLTARNQLEVRRKPGESLFPLLPSVGATWDF